MFGPIVSAGNPRTHFAKVSGPIVSAGRPRPHFAKVFGPIGRPAFPEHFFEVVLNLGPVAMADLEDIEEVPVEAEPVGSAKPEVHQSTAQR